MTVNRGENCIGLKKTAKSTRFGVVRVGGILGLVDKRAYGVEAFLGKWFTHLIRARCLGAMRVSFIVRLCE